VAVRRSLSVKSGRKAGIRAEIAEPASMRPYVRQLFGRIARRYDFTNDVMSLGQHRRWKRYLLGLAELKPGFRVLDLAAGTGDLAIGSLGEGVGEAETADGGVVAADLTPLMMAVGRRRRRAGRVLWVGSDALHLPFSEGTFDRVLIGYGLRNFVDLAGGLAEIRRCLKPGGRLLSLDFGKPRSPALRRLYFRYLEATGSAIGWLLHRDIDAYLYIPESLRRYPAQEELVGLMQRSGFVRCGFLELVFGAMAINFGERPAAEAG
jgi:demethylmenaquinone methyltransferase/2-methoxy-6-polyprenyl-1,4-benzoquinol methylase